MLRVLIKSASPRDQILFLYAFIYYTVRMNTDYWVRALDKFFFFFFFWSTEGLLYLSYVSTKTYVVLLIRSSSLRHF